MKTIYTEGLKGHLALRYEARRELTFFEGTLGIQICHRIVSLTLWNTSARKKNPPTLYPQTRESRIPLCFLVETRPREQKSHFWICPGYGAIWDRFFVVNLSIKLFPTTKKKTSGFLQPPSPHNTKLGAKFPKSAPKCYLPNFVMLKSARGVPLGQSFFFRRGFIPYL